MCVWLRTRLMWTPVYRMMLQPSLSLALPLLDLPWGPEEDKHVAGIVRNQQLWLHYGMEDRPWEMDLTFNLAFLWKESAALRQRKGIRCRNAFLDVYRECQCILEDEYELQRQKGRILVCLPLFSSTFPQFSCLNVSFPFWISSSVPACILLFLFQEQHQLSGLLCCFFNHLGFAGKVLCFQQGLLRLPLQLVCFQGGARACFLPFPLRLFPLMAEAQLSILDEPTAPRGFPLQLSHFSGYLASWLSYRRMCLFPSLPCSQSQVLALRWLKGD